LLGSKFGIGIQNYILLGASLVFYAWGEPVYVFLMVLSILMTYILGRIIEVHPKVGLVIGVAYHVLMLFIFKYSTFITSQIGGLFREEYVPKWDIALPIGISFYSFQLMSYLFDVYYKRASVQKSIFSLALYATMFPQLIAGPIVRYNEIDKEIGSRVFDRNDFYEGTERFIYGLGKKVLLADNLAYVVDIIWSLDSRPGYVAWVGAICYTLQIYYDFSGYSDMAIGLGRMFGFHFSENFNYPYVSKSVTEFWRRWHISLGSWFRDYVYIPLGGNRVSKGKWLRNIFIVWLLTGIWHGANWTFLIWGLIYFCVLIVEKITEFPAKLKGFSHLYTMLIVTLAWVVFRSGSIGLAFRIIGEMFGLGNYKGLGLQPINITIIGTIFVIIISAALAVPLVPYIYRKIRSLSPKLYGIIRPVIAIIVFALAFSKVMAQSYTAFIYFNF